MAGMNDLIDLIPVDQLAKQLGVDPAQAQDGIEAALPAILGGLGANAKDPAGAASLDKALDAKDGSLLDGGVDVSKIDTADGEKIVKNVFGEKTDGVAAALGGAKGSQDTDLVKKLLPMVAPIVMAYLAKQKMGSKSGSSAGGIDAGDLISSVLGGGKSGGGLDDLIGGLLGGKSGGSGGLGDLLGGLLGGGKR